jgi:hypothetical protein
LPSRLVGRFSFGAIRNLVFPDVCPLFFFALIFQ